MLSFKNISKDIKISYNSARSGENLINDFYVPVLSNSKKYDRISGYFSSTSLAIASRGVSKFIENEGHMRLICGNQLNSDDVDAIKNANVLKKIVNEKFLKDYNSLEDGLKKDYIKLLGWMIANNFLEIKIAFNRLNPGEGIDNLMHTKTGLLYDENNDIIFFIGSINETASGWGNNLEAINVIKSWEYKEGIIPHIIDFDESWNGKFPNMMVMDVPEASIKQLIKDAPNDSNELKRLLEKIENKSQKIIKYSKKPFLHQKNAIDAWFGNGKRGILSMATGTGKTLTALWCLEKIIKDEDVLTVIACPYIHLLDQWKNEIRNLELGKIYEFYGDANSKWGIEFDRLKSKINNGVKFNKPQIILTSHQTFHEKKFTNKIKLIKKQKFLIVDEVHHVGAKKYSDGLISDYDFRLGLSATPERYMDYEGTEYIKKYFEGEVFKFTILDALTRRNYDTNEPFLTPYNYHPIKVNLTDEESKNRSLAINSVDKYRILKEILKEIKLKNNGDIDHLIIFCSKKQLNEVFDILEVEQIKPKHEFTYRQNLKQRKSLLKEFDLGTCKVLVAMRCLNEGVDVPSTDKVIIMSSSSNPAEYIQRRGRVLRRCDGKEKADIYDLVVIPKKDNTYLNKFFNKEHERLIEFISTADNSKDCFNLLNEWGLI